MLALLFVFINIVYEPHVFRVLYLRLSKKLLESLNFNSFVLLLVYLDIAWWVDEYVVEIWMELGQSLAAVIEARCEAIQIMSLCYFIVPLCCDSNMCIFDSFAFDSRWKRLWFSVHVDDNLLFFEKVKNVVASNKSSFFDIQSFFFY